MNLSRNWELDKCRILACLMVVMLHVASTGWFIDPTTFEWRIFNLADTMVRGSVPLFFMISGTLFFQKEELDLGNFLRKNVTHLIVLYFVWSSLYEIINCIRNSQFELGKFFLAVCKGHYHLWFLPAMIVSYLFLPVVYHALRGHSLTPAYLIFLFGFITLLSVNANLIPELPEIAKTLLDKFNIRDMQYVGYMVWGYFLSRKQFGKKTRLISILIYGITGLLTAAANRWFSIDHGQAISWLYGYFTIPTFIQATAIFCFFQTWRGKSVRHPAIWQELSACTLGIYLLHPMVLEILSLTGLKVSDGNPLYQIPVVFTATVAICLFIIFLIRRIAYIRKLV